MKKRILSFILLFAMLVTVFAGCTDVPLGSGEFTSTEETTTNGEGTTTESEGTTTNGEGTTTESEGTTTDGDGTTTNGDGTTTNGEGTTTEGEGSTTEGEGSTTEGEGSTTEGEGSTTEGEGSTTEGEGTTTEGEGTTTEGEVTTTVEETTTEIENNEVYGNGGDVKDAGAVYEEGDFALTENVIDESGAVNITSAELKTLLVDKNALTGSEVYRVTDALVLDGDCKYYGNGATLIVTEGVVIKDATSIVMKGIVIKGSITVENSSKITLFEVDLQSDKDALIIDDKSSDIAIKSCRITASGTAITSGADLFSVYSTYVCGVDGMKLVGDDCTIQNCDIIAVNTAISACGEDFIARNNTIALDVNGVGIEVLEGSQNALVAMNVIKDAQTSVRVSGGYNCVVLLNSAINVIGENNTNLYVVENNLGGIITVKNNNYLICDDNKFVNDKKNHDVVQTGNENTNGNTLMDVNARAEVGANEDLLPHSNKILFVGMERKEKVKDISNVKTYGFNEYIRENAKKNSVVIVPPGAYTVNGTLELGSAQKGTAVYAYGVLQELTAYATAFRISESSDIRIQGLAVAYTGQSCGQVHVVEKMSPIYGTVRVVPSAGFLTEFSKDGVDGVCGDSFLDVYAYNEEDGRAEMYNWTPETHKSTVINDDGTMTITLSDKALWSQLNVGDIFTCRLNGGDGNVRIYNSQDIKLKDVTVYGVSTALSIVAETDYLYSSGSVSGIELERVHNTADGGRVIDEATYNKYLAWEEKYGVKLEVWQDKKGYYHGAAARVGSLDATHISACDEGLKITSCLFESMADDGTNHKGMSARLHAIKDNGDGTTTITYKNNLSTWQFSHSNQTIGNVCKPFQVGETVYIYTNEGEVVCETRATTAAVATSNFISCEVNGRTCSYKTYDVQVDTSAINWDALYDENGEARYDLFSNGLENEQKVLVDNLSHNSAGAVFDNVLVRYVRSRGFLIKTTGVVIKHCTFKDIAGTAVKFSSELTWGESSVPKDALVYKCLFDHVGYDEHDFANKVNAGIAIHNEVGGDKFNENGMNCKNIIIEGCKFTNNENRYAIHIQNAQGITIKNCTFDENKSTYEGVAVSIIKAMNIEISDNTYNYSHSDDITKLVVSNEAKNVFGTDVTDEDGNKLIPDSIVTE